MQKIQSYSWKEAGLRDSSPVTNSAREPLHAAGRRGARREEKGNHPGEVGYDGSNGGRACGQYLP